MYEFDDPRELETRFLDHDSAILEALMKVDRGLFDVPDTKDDDLDALYDT